MVRYYYDYTYWYRSDGAILLRLHVLVTKRWCDTTTTTRTGIGESSHNAASCMI